jgi:hypothetical protein
MTTKYYRIQVSYQKGHKYYDPSGTYNVYEAQSYYSSLFLAKIYYWFSYTLREIFGFVEPFTRMEIAELTAKEDDILFCNVVYPKRK